MKKVLRKIVSMLSVGIMAVSLAACGASSADSSTSVTEAASAESSVSEEAVAAVSEETEAAEPVTQSDYEHPIVKEKLKVGLMIQYVNAESMIRNKYQAEIEAAHRDWELIVNEFETADKFRDAFQSLMNQDVDAIILCNTESMDSRVDLIKQAREKGIGVYCNDNQVVDGIICNSTMPGGVASMELAYKIGEDNNWNLNMCVLNYKTGQVHLERAYPFEALTGALGQVYPNYKLLAEEDASSGTQGSGQACYEFTQAWLQKYGDEMNGIFATCDEMAFGAVEAISQSGDTTGEKCFVSGIDGGNQAWRYIRENTPFQYCYSQPFELFTHKVFEVIDQIQVQGLNPGDEGCDISEWGETMYSTGIVVTRDNCPEIGQSVHSVYDYYGGDPDDADAWYNWTDGPGIYVVSDGE